MLKCPLLTLTRSVRQCYQIPLPNCGCTERTSSSTAYFVNSVGLDSIGDVGLATLSLLLFNHCICTFDFLTFVSCLLTATLHIVDVRLTCLINITYLLTYLLTYLRECCLHSNSFQADICFLSKL